MQPDPSKNYGNIYVNPYPPVNQPQFGTENVYPPNEPPPAYSQYPQQPAGYQSSGTGYYGQQPSGCQRSGAACYGQRPLYEQQGPVTVPVYRQQWNILIPTPITRELRRFFIISGILSLIWGILDMGLEIAIILNSDSRYYRGLWAGGFLVGAGICMLVASCRVAYIMAHLIRMFIVTLIFIIMGFVLSIIDLNNSARCDSYYWYYCDDKLATHLKITMLVLFVISTVHNSINISVVSNAQKRAIIARASNVPGY